jgi:hypothetical protein
MGGLVVGLVPFAEDLNDLPDVGLAVVVGAPPLGGAFAFGHIGPVLGGDEFRLRYLGTKE